MVRLIAFDMDGTLIDSRLDIAGAVNYMRGTMGLEPLSVERVVSFVGNGVSKLVRRAIADAEVDFDEALRRMRNYYSEHLVVSTALYPGVKDGVIALHQRGIKLAVVTNKPSRSADFILKKFSIDPFFGDVSGGDSDYPLKPEPDALNAICKKYQFQPSECWMVGDHYVDLEAGRRAGFKRALARYGFGDPHDEVPDLEVNTFDEFVKAILEY